MPTAASRRLRAERAQLLALATLRLIRAHISLIHRAQPRQTILGPEDGFIICFGRVEVWVPDCHAVAQRDADPDGVLTLGVLRSEAWLSVRWRRRRGARAGESTVEVSHRSRSLSNEALRSSRAPSGDSGAVRAGSGGAGFGKEATKAFHASVPAAPPISTHAARSVLNATSWSRVAARSVKPRATALSALPSFSSAACPPRSPGSV
eukprot:scaffold39238_cov36-Phaeocystis_antarctica.AAC.2